MIGSRSTGAPCFIASLNANADYQTLGLLRANFSHKFCGIHQTQHHGRGHDLSKLQAFLELQQMNPEAQTRLNWGQIMIMEATALGINTENLIKTDEELQAEQQQQMMANMAEKASPQLAKGMMEQGGETE